MCGKTEILVTYIHGAAFISEQLQYKILYCECSDMNAAPCLYVLVKYFVKTFHKCNSVMSRVDFTEFFQTFNSKLPNRCYCKLISRNISENHFAHRHSPVFCKSSVKSTIL